jgi:hypothetical protein
MDNADNTAKSFAEEGLEETQKEAAEVEATMTNLTALSTDTVEEEDELVQIGGLEPIALFFRTKAPKKATTAPFKVLEKGDTISGTYERSFIAGKFNNPTHLIRMAKDAAPVAGTEVAGKLVGIAGTGSLNRAIDKLLAGSKVKIVYEGMSTIKNGKWEGQDAHNFTAFGNKLKA